MVSVIILASVAVLVLVMTILGANGVLPRNRVVGLRIAALLASDESWRVGHRAAILPTAVGALLSVVSAVAFLVQQPFPTIAPLVVTITVLGPLIWAAIRANHAPQA